MSKNPVIKYHFNVGKTKESKELVLTEFIEVKGWKAMGNKLIDAKLTKVELIQADETSLEVDTEAEAPAEDIIDTSSVPKKELKLPSETKDPGKKQDSDPKENKDSGKSGLKPGDTIEFDF